MNHHTVQGKGPQNVVESPRGAGGSWRLMNLRVSFRIVNELTSVSLLSPGAKFLYVVTMLDRPASLHALATKAQLDPKTTAKHCRELERQGWMRLVEDAGRQKPVATLPAAVEALVASEVSQEIDTSHFKGEETTKAFVDWIVSPRVRLMFDSRPGFLKNPETGQNLEYDILAPDHHWAIEHQGDQHFGVTDLYPDRNQFRERQKRDVMKVGLSDKCGIRLSLVTKMDLSFEKLLPMVPPDVPRRDFDPKGPFAQMLERAGRECAGKPYWDRE